MLLDRTNYRHYYFRLQQAYRGRPALSASIEIILTVFTITFMVSLALRPTLGIIATLQKKIADQEIVRQKITTKIVALRTAQQALVDHSAQLPFYERAVPDSHEIADLSARLELLAQETGVSEEFSLETISLIGENFNVLTTNTTKKQLDGRQLSGEEAIALSVSFRLEGQLDEIADFLNKVERMDRVLTIRSITLQRQESSQKKVGSVHASIKAEVYYKLKSL